MRKPTTEKDESINLLKQLGLTYGQAIVYLTLTKTGKLTAHQISKITGTARADSYRILNQLLEKGLVQKQITKPEIYTATPIANGMEKLVREREDESSQIRLRSEKLVKGITCVANKPDVTTAQFVLHSSKMSVYGRIEKLLQRSKKSVDIVAMPQRISDWVLGNVNVTRNAIERGVKFRIIAPRIAAESDAVKTMENLKHANRELRFLAEFPQYAFAVFDKKEVTIATAGVKASVKNPVLWTNNENVVEAYLKCFETMWKETEREN